jgi:hypothetical protein
MAAYGKTTPKRKSNRGTLAPRRAAAMITRTAKSEKITSIDFPFTAKGSPANLTGFVEVVQEL